MPKRILGRITLFLIAYWVVFYLVLSFISGIDSRQPPDVALLFAPFLLPVTWLFGNGKNLFLIILAVYFIHSIQAWIQNHFNSLHEKLDRILANLD